MQRVDVLDLSGRLVRRLASGWSAAGARSLTWDGTDTVGAPLPAGIYLVRARVGDAVTRTRVTLVR
jgi:flagellar hook assembly protein FlgD